MAINIDLIIALIGLVLTVVTTIIAIIDIKSTIKDNRKNNLLLSDKLLSSEYWKVYENVRELYHKTLFRKNADNNSFSTPSPMLYKEGWLYQKGPLPKLTNISLEYVPPEFVKRKLKYNRHLQSKLPYPNKTFEQNLSLVCHSTLYNGRIYTPVELKVKNGNHYLRISNAYFFDFVNSCLRLSHNDAYSLSMAPKARLRASKAFYPFDFTNRVPTIGIVTLTVLFNVEVDNSSKKSAFFVLHKRSSNVAECKNMINAIPAGIYQPSFSGSSSVAEPLEYTVFREFGEELLGRKEFSELNDTEEIQQLFSEDQTPLCEKVYYLGAAINPVNLYMELLTILPIDMEKQNNKRILGDGTLKEIQKRLITNEESGEIFLEEFDLKKIRHYSHMHLSTPALKQIMTVLNEHFEEISTELFK